MHKQQSVRVKITTNTKLVLNRKQKQNIQIDKTHNVN